MQVEMEKTLATICKCVRFRTCAWQSVPKITLFTRLNIHEKIESGSRAVRDFCSGYELGVYTCLAPTLYLHCIKIFFLRAIPHFEEPEIVVSSSNRAAVKRNKFNIMNLSTIKTKISREVIALAFL